MENEDWAAALVELESGVRGTIELSRAMVVGAEARYVVEVNGTGGAVRWSFERLNELEVYSRTEAGDAGWTQRRNGAGPP